ncbi:MAG: dienelactone hydrolase family protein, partial [Sphingomonadaceae bacterium]
GLGEHAMERCRSLAALGYAALACDIHGDAEKISDVAGVMERVGPLMQDPQRTRARARGALDALLDNPDVDNARIVAIGFCFGGTMALELARSGADIAGAIGFHSGLSTASPGDARNIRCKVLVCLGADDPVVDADQRAGFEAEMRTAGVDWQMNLYGGAVHSFTNPHIGDHAGTNPAIARYDAGADHRSWAEMRRFFDEIFTS